MFSGEYMENIENRVPMTQHDADLIEQLLRFIYTFEVKDLTTFAPDLLPLADQVGLCLDCWYDDKVLVHLIVWN